MRLRSMHFGLTFLIYLGTAMLAGAEPQEKQSGKENAAREGWKLVWADEFDYTGLPDPPNGTTRWATSATTRRNTTRGPARRTPGSRGAC